MTDKPMKAERPERETKLGWSSIQDTARVAAKHFGHVIGPFDNSRNRPSVKMASCETCHGCLWVAYSPTRGYSTGGRLLKYQCGTKEAMGVL